MDLLRSHRYCCLMPFAESLAAQSWRKRVVLQKIAEEGATYHEAAVAAGVCRQRILKWRNRDPEFNALVLEARKLGEEKRTYLLWLRHPLRGKRPPRPPGSRGGYPKPRFSFGR